MLVAILALAVGIVIINGFAAGIVAIVHFWGSGSTVGKRAAIGALGSGIACVLLILGPILGESGLGGEGAAVAAIVSAIVLASGTAASLPGAIILSRKIGDSVSINPDTFA